MFAVKASPAIARGTGNACAASRRRESRLMRSSPGTTVGATPKWRTRIPRVPPRPLNRRDVPGVSPIDLGRDETSPFFSFF